jgi:hypothetical protein
MGDMPKSRRIQRWGGGIRIGRSPAGIQLEVGERGDANGWALGVSGTGGKRRCCACGLQPKKEKGGERSGLAGAMRSEPARARPGLAQRRRQGEG